MVNTTPKIIKYVVVVFVVVVVVVFLPARNSVLINALNQNC